MIDYEKEFDVSYKEIGSVFCPYFKGYIAFNADGLEHLKFKRKGVIRTPKDRDARIRIFPIAIKILLQSHTVQGIISRNRFEKRTIHSRKEIALSRVTYYEFLAIIDQVRAKVILKQIEDGPRTFLMCHSCF